MAYKKIILTKKAREQLEAEYRDLLDVQRPDVIENIVLAKSQGDLSENADYDAARDRQAKIEARITEIEEILNNAISVEESGMGSESGKIGIGDVVTFLTIATGEESTVAIVGQVGSDPFAEPPSVSNESPIGLALIGAEPGQNVFVESAERYEIQILSVYR